MKKTEGNSLCVRTLSVSYLGSQKSTKFSKETIITTTAIYEVPKPPANNLMNSELSKVANNVLAPTKDKTPIEEFNNKVKLVDVKLASTRYNGQCLREEDFKNISTVSCDATFKDILNKFNYNKDLSPDKFPNIESQ